MIEREQLAAALERLDPRDRELLEFSLRRRVPDPDLARVYETDPGDLARRRAAAVERLADSLGVRRGEDLGAMLKALLEPATWEPLDAADEPEPAPTPAPPDEDRRPVLEMLDEEAPERRSRGGRSRRVVAVLAGAAILAGGGVAVGAVALGGDDDRKVNGAAASRPFVPKAGGPLAAPFASDPKDITGYLTAAIRRPTKVYSSREGKAMLTLRPKTEWKSPRVLGVVEERAGWLAVQMPELKNGAVGWIRSSQAELGSVEYSLHADLSKRLLVVRRGGRVVQRMKVAIGRKANPTPTGRFSVTDKLRVEQEGSPYGCCVLALTGHQTDLPEDWPGGDRLAVHATTDTETIGKRVSLGCMRASSKEARWLIDTVPLGAPIFIRA